MRKLILAGGSGYLGQVLADYFKDKFHDIVILSRGAAPARKNIRTVVWNAREPGPWVSELDHADVLINLTGKSVDCRYTRKNKAAIYASRLESTRVMGYAIQRCSQPPGLWINASSATIYESSYDKDQTEVTGTIGNNFSMDVCKKWEAVFDGFMLADVRRVAIRTSFVLGREGGALPVLQRIARAGLGGRQGSGTQYVSWLHERDFARAIDWFIANDQAQGVYNLTAPGAITNSTFMQQLRESLHKTTGMPVPAWLLRIGAFIIRTEPELILKSRKVYPQRLLNEGFVFEFTDSKKALGDLCRLEMKRN
jgi:uncharacterized protein (TIGR01777 family)